MFAKCRAIQDLKSIIKKYNSELECCENKKEESELIDVIENLEWVVKEFKNTKEEANIAEMVR